jgi:hypothetical protein
MTIDEAKWVAKPGRGRRRNVDHIIQRYMRFNGCSELRSEYKTSKISKYNTK